ncbi:hypothetical protein [Mycoplasmopsis agassizii]|nr:hypothetical protein [Mycoplasmopsis agassizii]
MISRFESKITETKFIVEYNNKYFALNLETKFKRSSNYEAAKMFQS